MSDRSVEDQIIAETTSFAAKLGVLARQHAQAHGWWEQRKIRREISLTMRAQRRAEQAERAHQKAWTSQMIHRYQLAAQARYERAGDPRVPIEQRRRDDLAGERHIEDLRERIVGNTRLTEVERGIALDCLESARMWPYTQARTPEMLARAPKVRGLDALRYRAALARETAWVQQRRHERDTAGRDFAAPTVRQPVREQAPQPAVARPTGEMSPAQEDAVQKIRHAARENQAGQLRAAGDAAARAGLTPQRIDWEMRHAEQNSKFTSEVASLRNGDITVWRTYHPTEAEAAQWTAHNVGSANWLPGVQLKATIRERGNQTPLRLADGGIEHVTARTAEWARPEPQRGQVSEAEELASLKQRHHLSIEHNADLAERNATLTRQLTALTAERDRIATERDRFKTERDEAVQKVAARTPAAERLGSPERQAEQAKRESIPGHAFAGLVNGRDREGRER